MMSNAILLPQDIRDILKHIYIIDNKDYLQSLSSKYENFIMFIRFHNSYYDSCKENSIEHFKKIGKICAELSLHAIKQDEREK